MLSQEIKPAYADTEQDIEFIVLLSQEKDRAICNLLRIGNIKILLDCGCNEQVSQNLLDIVSTEAAKCNFILLSHSTHQHLGALPYYTKNYQKKNLDQDSAAQDDPRLKQKIIATSPVVKMGAQTMNEVCIQLKENPVIERDANGKNVGFCDFNHFNLQDIENAFEQIELVSYQEIKSFRIGDTLIVIKAFPSGNSVGGTVWQIEYNKLSIIYAFDINDHETPISLPLQFQIFKGSSLLITNAYIQPVQNNQKLSKIYNYVNEEKLLNRLEFVLKRDPRAQVILPISSKNRILHMLVLLEDLFKRSQNLQDQKIRPTMEDQKMRPSMDDKPVIYLEYMSRDTLDVAKSHLNWMNFKGRHNLDDNPFAFKHIKAINSIQEFQREMEDNSQNQINQNGAGPRPRVIVTSTASLERGYARHVIKEMINQQHSMIIFTEMHNNDFSVNGCIGSQVYAGKSDLTMEWYERIQDENQTNQQEEDIKQDQDQQINSQDNDDKQQSIEIHQDTQQLPIQTSNQQAKMTKQEVDSEFKQIQQDILKNLNTQNFILPNQSQFNTSSVTFNQLNGNIFPKLSYYGLDDLAALQIHSLNQTMENEQDKQEADNQQFGKGINRQSVQQQQAIFEKKKKKEDGEEKDDMDQPQQDEGAKEIYEIYNRYKELQKIYKAKFSYQYFSTKLNVQCQICYFPFEGRLDQETFELILQNSLPRQILLVTTSTKKVNAIKSFCQTKTLPIQVYQAPMLNFQNQSLVPSTLILDQRNIQTNKSITPQHPNCFQISTNSAVKQIVLQSQYYKRLQLQKILAGTKSTSMQTNLQFQNSKQSTLQDGYYEIARVRANLKCWRGMSYENKYIDENDQIILCKPEQVVDNAKPSLFFRMASNYSMRELQKFLEVHNFVTILLHGCLNYQDKVFIYFDEVQDSIQKQKQDESTLMKNDQSDQNQIQDKQSKQKAANDKIRKQIRFTGTICKEYFQIRRLVYQHFGRL